MYCNKETYGVNSNINLKMYLYVRFSVFTTVMIQIMVFWVVMPGSDVVGYCHFGVFYCCYLWNFFYYTLYALMI